MGRPANYKSKHRDAIEAYLLSLGGEHTTANQAAAYFSAKGRPISLSTVYRHLERLASDGKARKYTLNGVDGTCYQYAGEGKEANPQNHFHLKCENCGVLLHLRCDTLNEIGRHVFEKHIFRINAMKTIFYGVCATCLNDQKGVS
jgi:Fur family ferric uptake transcriptional regulator